MPIALHPSQAFLYALSIAMSTAQTAAILWYSPSRPQSYLVIFLQVWRRRESCYKDWNAPCPAEPLAITAALAHMACTLLWRQNAPQRVKLSSDSYSSSRRTYRYPGGKSGGGKCSPSNSPGTAPRGVLQQLRDRRDVTNIPPFPNMRTRHRVILAFLQKKSSICQ